MSRAQSYGKTFLNGASVEKNCRSRISLERCRKAEKKAQGARQWREGDEREAESGGCAAIRGPRAHDGGSITKMAATEAAASTSRAAATTSSQASLRSASANCVTVLLFCILDPSWSQKFPRNVFTNLRRGESFSRTRNATTPKLRAAILQCQLSAVHHGSQWCNPSNRRSLYQPLLTLSGIFCVHFDIFLTFLHLCNFLFFEWLSDDVFVINICINR